MADIPWSVLNTLRKLKRGWLASFSKMTHYSLPKGLGKLGSFLSACPFFRVPVNKLVTNINALSRNCSGMSWVGSCTGAKIFYVVRSCTLALSRPTHTAIFSLGVLGVLKAIDTQKCTVRAVIGVTFCLDCNMKCIQFLCLKAVYFKLAFSEFLTVDSCFYPSLTNENYNSCLIKRWC